MPADLTIGSTPPPVPDAPRFGSVPTRQAFVQPPASPVATGAGEARVPDNRVVLDPASDRVVLEYFDATGALVNSLPSQRQLDAYRLAASAAPEQAGLKNS